MNALRWRVAAKRNGSEEETTNMTKPRILIIEDERALTDVLSYNLQREGYEPIVANDGQEGVEVFRTAIRESRSPLTVTDLKMPIMGGIDLLQQVRQADPDAAVIVLTGAADVKTAIASLKLGAYDFIMKPVNVDELLIAADRVPALVARLAAMPLMDLLIEPPSLEEAFLERYR